MLRIDSMSTSYNGAIVQGNNQIAYLSASRTGDNVSISINISDLNTYVSNIDSFKEDIDQFLDEVSGISNNTNS